MLTRFLHLHVTCFAFGGNLKLEGERSHWRKFNVLPFAETKPQAIQPV
jgi:hypothetical protein